MTRVGLKIPLDGVALADHDRIVQRAGALGYTDLWTSETNAADGFTPLAMAAVQAPRARLGSAIIPAFTRGPATLAMSFAAMADLAGGRFVAGIGSSSPIIVENWNATPFEAPYQRVRDTIRFLREAFSGDKVDRAYETFRIDGFRLGRVPDQPPPIHLGALRSGMLRLAGREADGVIINWMAASDVPRLTAEVERGGTCDEVVARLLVCPSGDADVVRTAARRHIAAYLNVPAYAAYQRWLGRGTALEGMWERWEQGDRRGAVSEIPDEVVDELVVHGPPDRCRAHLAEFQRQGATTAVIELAPWAMTPEAALDALGDVSALTG